MDNWSIFLQPDNVRISTSNRLDFMANSICFLMPDFTLVDHSFDLEDFSKSLNFDFIFSNRKTAYFGKYSYSYGHTTHIPKSIDDNEYIRKLFYSFIEIFPYSNVNSVLINCYSNDSSHLPFHADNEIYIANDSYIFTLSLGCDRQICFRDALSHNSLLKVNLQHGSLICFSKRSQELFEHSILPACYKTKAGPQKFAYRISLTFRHVKH